MNHAAQMHPGRFDDVQPTRRTCPEFGKTNAELANPIECYRTPLWKRALWAFCRHGWVLVPVVLSVAVLSGCQSDIDTYAAMQADLADAVATAAKEGIHE